MSEPANPPSEPPPEDLPERHAAEPTPLPTDLEPLASLKPPNARPTPEPLEVDAVRIVMVGTALWFAGFLVLLPFRGRLAEQGNEVWLWTCLAGGLLGLLGLLLAARARTAARARSAAARRR